MSPNTSQRAYSCFLCCLSTFASAHEPTAGGSHNVVYLLAYLLYRPATCEIVPPGLHVDNPAAGAGYIAGPAGARGHAAGPGAESQRHF